MSQQIEPQSVHPVAKAIFFLIGIVTLTLAGLLVVILFFSKKELSAIQEASITAMGCFAVITAYVLARCVEKLLS